MLRPMSQPNYRAPSRIPQRAGVGLRIDQAREILRAPRGVAFLEMRAENLASDAAPLRALLSVIRERFPLSLRSAALSIGRMRSLDRRHLANLQRLVALYRPGAFSAPLAPAAGDAGYPPADESTVSCIATHVDQVQNVLGLRMLLECSVAETAGEGIAGRAEVLAEIIARTDCRLSLDLGIVAGGAVRAGLSPADCLDALPLAAVGQIRLPALGIDSHLPSTERPAAATAAWAIYTHLIAQIGPAPTLLDAAERVSYPALAGAAVRANAIMDDICVANFRRIA